MREVTVSALTAEAFEPFGHVLSGPPIEGFNGRPHAKPVIELVDAEAFAESHAHVVSVLERHPHSSQAFVPFGAASYLVVVAAERSGGLPDVEGLVAFEASARTAIQYRPGIWHAPISATGQTRRFVMQVHKDGTSADTEFFEIEPLRIAFPQPARAV